MDNAAIHPIEARSPSWLPRLTGARLLHDFNGGACPVWWVACEPTIQKLRADYDDPTEYAKFEWLAGVMDTFDANRGASVFDATMLAAQLTHRIGTYEDQMRLDEELG